MVKYNSILLSEDILFFTTQIPDSTINIETKNHNAPATGKASAFGKNKIMAYEMHE